MYFVPFLSLYRRRLDVQGSFPGFLLLVYIKQESCQGQGRAKTGGYSTPDTVFIRHRGAELYKIYPFLVNNI
ncbi:hypothetical protein TREPR_0160 [Treponema primitia ZAS-2]|uniref:Uncharacterized protein n=1 Tax=Treponema primitia (strain ATCC BAA-887 / DSM 12427 / ZAS-2) TaxID=545694 RepID=F5YMG2_TREPZ|nr:hypothetical protein TREPR_0160 [Treponema primitia ZAS-2]